MKQKNPTASRLRVPRIGPAIFPRYCCDCPKARFNPTKRAAPPTAKSKKFAHGTSRVTGNLAKKGKLANPTRQSRNPTHRRQFQKRLFIDVPPDYWLRRKLGGIAGTEFHRKRQPKGSSNLPALSNLPNAHHCTIAKASTSSATNATTHLPPTLNGTTK